MKMKPEAEQLIIDQCKRFKLPIPDGILNKPKLLPGLELYYEAFLELNNDRSGNGIRWESIACYATFYGFDEEQTDDLLTHIRAMDAAFMKQVK